MATDPERVKALFLAAMERSDPADRRAFLDGDVGDDELRDRLEALLGVYDKPPAALDRPLGAPGCPSPPILTPPGLISGKKRRVGRKRSPRSSPRASSAPTQ
jgi:hypothetical protein